MEMMKISSMRVGGGCRRDLAGVAVDEGVAFDEGVNTLVMEVGALVAGVAVDEGKGRWREIREALDLVAQSVSE